MGKVRKVVLGDLEAEEEQKRKAEARREAKKAKKAEVEEMLTDVAEGKDVGKKAPEAAAETKAADAEDNSEEPKKKKMKKKDAEDAAPAKKHSDKYQKIVAMVDRSKQYAMNDAISLVKKTSYSKFDGTVELHINLNPSTLGGKTDMRGSVALPHGTGKKIRVAVADEAIIAEVSEGKINFDILVAHPSMMPKLARVARILGPRGLMPNPKTGTVTPDVEKRVKELSSGQVNFKTEPNNPIIHMAVGKVSFEDNKLAENIQAVISAVGAGKISKATLKATMGPGVKVALA